MKRLFILIISLLLLTACGGVPETPTEPTTEVTTTTITTEEPTTEAPATEPIEISAAKPFTKDDIATIETNFKTVGDYVNAVPAAWYKVDHWDAYGCEIFVHFFDHKPNEASQAFLYLQLRDETLCDIIEYKYTELLQELPKVLLDTKKAEIRSIDFAKIGSAITPPRGIKVGDSAQKIFDSYPDYRTGDSDVLYDITKLYPEAKPEWGKWDGEGWSNINFMGGGIMAGGVGFSYAEQPWGWDDRESDYTWLNMYNPRYLLTYQVEYNIITGIEYKLLYHPG